MMTLSKNSKEFFSKRFEAFEIVVLKILEIVFFQFYSTPSTVVKTLRGKRVRT